MHRSKVDLVIVGAGAAGLGAAITALERGLEFVVFEAGNRPGGRAFTDCGPFGFPWDAGCHWLHLASVNPFRRFAAVEGFRVRSTPTPWHPWVEGRVATDQERQAIDAYIADSLTKAIAMGERGEDVPLSTVVNTTSRWFGDFRAMINAEWGVDPDFCSTLDLARYRDTEEDWPVEDSYGALLLRVASPVLNGIELNTPVESIAVSSSGVRVTTAEGAVEAGAVIVTASTNVLAEDVIAFDPILPLWKREAFSSVPLGSANKVALLLTESALCSVAEENFSVSIGSEQRMSIRLRPFGRNLADEYLAGPKCAELEAAGKEMLIDVVTSALVSLLGSDVRNEATGAAVSLWGTEPYMRGAYAAALPGLAGKRVDLRRQVGDRLSFAGEATSPEYFSTCHGAWESGVSAAESVFEHIIGGARRGAKGVESKGVPDTPTA